VAVWAVIERVHRFDSIALFGSGPQHVSSVHRCPFVFCCKPVLWKRWFDQRRGAGPQTSLLKQFDVFCCAHLQLF